TRTVHFGDPLDRHYRITPPGGFPMKCLAYLACALVLVACAPDNRGGGDGDSDGNDTGDSDGSDKDDTSGFIDAGGPDNNDPKGSVSGTVWAPGQAPGMVAA